MVDMVLFFIFMFFLPLFLSTLTLCIKDYGGKGALENSISGEEGGFISIRDGWTLKQQEQFLEFVLAKLGNLSLQFFDPASYTRHVMLEPHYHSWTTLDANLSNKVVVSYIS